MESLGKFWSRDCIIPLFAFSCHCVIDGEKQRVIVVAEAQDSRLKLLKIDLQDSRSKNPRAELFTSIGDDLGQDLCHEEDAACLLRTECQSKRHLLWVLWNVLGLAEFTLQQDWAPAHSSNCFPAFRVKEVWPSNSLDLNLVDYSKWSILKQEDGTTPYVTVDALKTALGRNYSESVCEHRRKCIEVQIGNFEHLM